jgi:hypothetical protein
MRGSPVRPMLARAWAVRLHVESPHGTRRGFPLFHAGRLGERARKAEQRRMMRLKEDLCGVCPR